jgi:hypothetical protein
MKEDCLAGWLSRYVICTQPHEAKSDLLGRLGVKRGQCAGKGDITCNRIRIAVVTDPTHFRYQGEYLGHYEEFSMKSADFVYVVIIFIEI